MEEILIVPDVHGRRFWEPALDYTGQVVFLGDYFDPYSNEGINEEEAYENFLDIVDFKTENPDRVTLLIGNHELDGSLPSRIAQIAADTDILMSHVPPFGILDTADGNSYGSPHLLEAVRRIKPRYHLFGHIHAAYGTARIERMTFVNGAIVDDNYQLANEPIIVETQ